MDFIKINDNIIWLDFSGGVVYCIEFNVMNARLSTLFTYRLYDSVRKEERKRDSRMIMKHLIAFAHENLSRIIRCLERIELSAFANVFFIEKSFAAWLTFVRPFNLDYTLFCEKYKFNYNFYFIKLIYNSFSLIKEKVILICHILKNDNFAFRCEYVPHTQKEIIQKKIYPYILSSHTQFNYKKLLKNNIFFDVDNSNGNIPIINIYIPQSMEEKSIQDIYIVFSEEDLRNAIIKICNDFYLPFEREE